MENENLSITYLDDSHGLNATIMTSDNIIYVFCYDIEDDIIKAEIEEISKKLIEKYEVLNVMYSENYNTYNILRKGSYPEDIL
ncbi:hypothetical protein [Inconstantimicrobium porci]|uniref:Uncharacterized protein n=1 Tax=Inconstantimicrobium porci TaxID=2652291 RepID=A0A7X2N0Z8_9CLOT|nr:hypothetical protein [Inconstantimicrobium porci]MSR92739.1 hypothetical protein [Inconstantimicrobium porci]